MSRPVVPADLTAQRRGDVPPRHVLVLGVLIAGAVVANVNLAIANVALPAIGTAFAAPQPLLNLVGVAFILGLASSVLYLGAIADHIGRKRALITGAALTVPLSLAAAWAPTIESLIVIRFLGGVASGMLYPTTLSLISLMFKRAAKTRAIALWSGISAGFATLGPVLGGALVVRFWWGSVFVPMAVLAAVVVVGAALLLPNRAGARAGSVDHPGGFLSVVCIGPLVLGISLVPDFGFGPQVLGLLGVAGVALAGFVVVERRAADPLFDFGLLRVRTYWPAIFAGTVMWGALLGAKFIGQQYMQYVLGFSPYRAALNGVPAGIVLIALARPAGRIVNRLGGRSAMLVGLSIAALGFASMALLFGMRTSPWVAAVTYLVVAIGTSLAGPPSSNALMRSVPPARAGMASASNDLQRDFGGALFQAVMASLLAVQYSRSFGRAFATLSAAQPTGAAQVFTRQVNDSFVAAQDVAVQFAPADAARILTAAKAAFTAGKTAGLVFATVATVVAIVVVAVWFPRKADETAAYAAIADPSVRAGASAAAGAASAAPPPSDDR